MRVLKLDMFNGFAEYHEGFDGYLLGLSLEVRKADGSLGYSSNMYIPSEHAKNLRLFIGETYRENCDICGRGVADMTYFERKIARMWEMCDHDGNEPTGRLEFNGYFEEYYDFEEREECVRDLTKEVKALWAEYVS